MKPSKPKKAEHKDKSHGPSGTKRNPALWAVWVIIILAIVVLAMLKNRSGQSRPTESGPSTLPAKPASSTNASSTAAQTKPDFRKLKGKWLRPDGGYVIEIRSAEDNGKLDATYANPSPVHLARAEASRDGAATKVFIELRDVNYPGSTDTLTYVPDRDLLVGIYYQALQQQSFEVYLSGCNETPGTK
jgi:hypothetical protein